MGTRHKSYHSIFVLDRLACGPRGLPTELSWRFEDVGDTSVSASVDECDT